MDVPDKPRHGPMKLPISNQIRVDIEHLEETLRLYESDGKGFIGKVPKIR